MQRLATPPRSVTPPPRPLHEPQTSMRVGQTSPLAKSRSRIIGMGLPLHALAPAPQGAATDRPRAHRTHRPIDQSVHVPASSHRPSSGQRPTFAPPSHRPHGCMFGAAASASFASTHAMGAPPVQASRAQQRPPILATPLLIGLPSDVNPLSTRREVNPPSTRRSLASCASQWNTPYGATTPPLSQRTALGGAFGTDLYSA